jgi:uncharacterized protein YndB with AHSA1/START domain
MAVTKSIDIAASPERVWQEFADPTVWASWMGRYHRTEPMEGATTLQPGIKVRVYWTERSRDRDHGPRTIDREATWDVPAVLPGKMVQMGQRPNFTTWTLEPVAGGTRVSMQAELKSFAAKLFGPIARFFTGAQGSIDLKQLKKKCEESQAG